MHITRQLLAVGLAASALLTAVPASAVLASYTATSNKLDSGLGLLSDGIIPANGTPAQSSQNIFFFDPTTSITFNFGATPVAIASLLATVDNNDDYVFTFFNGSTSLGSRTILASDGVVPVSPGGVETFSGDPAAGYTYLPALTFVTPFMATSAVLTIGTVHDIGEAVGEVQFNAAPTVGGVPEPATWALLLVGFGGIGVAARARRFGRSGTA